MDLPRRAVAMLAAGLLALAAGCGGQQAGDQPPPLVIGGIPDQDVALLEERFEGIAAYLSEQVGIPIRYQPSVDYTAVVTAFANGDVLLAWFGGLTGVQARLETPGAHAVAQREIDREFRSVFIAGDGVQADSLDALAGHTFTFGSESSTSGHLMPRYFLTQAGVDPETAFDGQPSYSGSHDRTWKLVEAGSFGAGVLNESVWQRAVDEGQVDTGRVRVVARTPPYVDYHWVAHPAIDEIYGQGTTERIVEALLAMGDGGEEAQEVLSLFEDSPFVETDDDNYETIERVARDLDLVGAAR